MIEWPDCVHEIEHSCGHAFNHWLDGEKGSAEARAELAKKVCPACKPGSVVQIEEVDDDEWLRWEEGE